MLRYLDNLLKSLSYLLRLFNPHALKISILITISLQAHLLYAEPSALSTANIEAIATPESFVRPALKSQGGDLNGKSKGSDKLTLLADIRVHSVGELNRVLKRVENLFERGDITSNDSPVIFLLHGEEARSLFIENYSAHKDTVDIAAKLSAFGVAEIKVCETWMGGNGLDKNNLHPFVGSVPYVPEEKRALLKRGAQYF